jgi:hypothetical protein
MNNFLLGQPWALKLVWAVNVQNYTILPGTLISAVNDGPIYTFFLEWSTTQGGVYAVASTFVLPTVTSPTNFLQGVSGGLFQRNDARWLRLRVAIGGGGRSVTFGAGFTKLTGVPGLGSQPNAVLVAP